MKFNPSCLRISVLVFATVLAIVAEAASSFAQSRPLITVDRSIGEATLAEIDADGRLRFTASSDASGDASGSFVVDSADLVTWGSPAEFGRRTYVVTIDGGIFAADTVAVTGETLDLLSPLFDSRSLPLARVRGIVFNAPAARQARDRLFQMLAAEGEGDRDRLLLVGGDELQGTLEKLDSRQATMETSLGPAKIDLGRTTAVVFNPALADEIVPPAPRLLIGLADGSLIVAAKATGGARVAFVPVAAAADAKPSPDSTAAMWQVDRSEIVFIQTLGGRAVYLSDLKPLGYKHVPYLDLPRDYRLNRSVGGGDLRAGGRRYLKGVGMHSTSRLTFPLSADHHRFAATIAVDDETAGRGSVTFRIFVDAEERFRSEIVRGGDEPLPIEVDVAGGKTLSLVVDFADQADVQDRADWLNARLLP